MNNTVLRIVVSVAVVIALAGAAYFVYAHTAVINDAISSLRRWS